MSQNWIDRAIGTVAPRAQLRRVRARIATDLVLRHYEAAAVGRRTQGWHRTSGDVNAANASLARIRDTARDLIRNNGQMRQALRTIANHTVGWGIVAKPEPANERLLKTWRAWAETTACDADGRHDFYGLQKLVIRGVAESGEMLVRRRVRKLEDGLPIPLQLQVIEPDLLDTGKSVARLPNGGQIIQGVEFGPLGDRVAYWLFPSHPGSSVTTGGTLLSGSKRIPAGEILHVFEGERAGQVRAVSWFAAIVLSAKDLDDYGDAQLMKQKIAACLAVLTSDSDGTGAPLGTVDPAQPLVDSLEPGMIANIAAGRSVEIVQPPQARDYDSYAKNVLRAIATGIGTTYEDLTGDYQDLPFSAARMSRIRHWSRVEDWRWRLMIPQFCEPVWSWAMQAARIMGQTDGEPASVWAAPPAPMVDPVNEGLAIMRNVRAGIQSLSDALRERGMDPGTVFAEMAADNAKLDELGLILDSDPRHMTQAGQLQGSASAAEGAKPTGPVPVDTNMAHAIGMWPRR